MGKFVTSEEHQEAIEQILECLEQMEERITEMEEERERESQ